MSNNPSIARRGRPFALFAGTLIALLIASMPMSVPAVAEWQHSKLVNSLEYKQSHGYWDIVNLPEEFKLNAIHASALPNGKVLLVAGSGNNRDNFNNYYNDDKLSVLKTVVLDPQTMQIKNIPTPSDLFCSGHAVLQSGDVLIAGGTSGYEQLEGAVTKPAGAMTIQDEDPHTVPFTLKKGTKFTNDEGKTYVSTQDVTIKPATKVDRGNGDVSITHSSVTVFVEAVKADASYVNTKSVHYTIQGMKGTNAQNIYGQGGPMTLAKQDYRGDNKSYEFDYMKEKYVQTGDLNESRWYPSLPVLTNGNVLAVSGLDSTGQITTKTEQFDPSTMTWALGTDKAFPTYPALFRTQNPDVLFFSGSNAGYGPADKGRQPGFWNYKTGAFTPVSGLRDTDIAETSASVVLPPAKGSNDGSQSSRIMIAGGGGVGESPLSTARTDIIDLAAKDPHYTPGPDLPAKLRYLNVTVLPTDDVFASGGATGYRAKGNSYNHKSVMIDPTTGQSTAMADEIVGRSYHSGSLLLRDGRVLVFGNDPLYDDKANTAPGKFEQRLEIYTPPQLYHGTRPTLEGADSQQVQRGQQLSFGSNQADNIKTARLIPPSTTTHVTNVEQRSVAAVVKTVNGKVTVSVPSDENTLPDGWYMLFVTNGNGIPSTAKMVHVTH